MESGGTDLHGGPYFCHKCKGDLVHEGFHDVMEDWPLHKHLWTGWLPEDKDEHIRIIRIAPRFRANGAEMQIWYPATLDLPGKWVRIAPKPNRSELLIDTHASLGHCGRDKLY